jgi:hypothetical protein
MFARPNVNIFISEAGKAMDIYQSTSSNATSGPITGPNWSKDARIGQPPPGFLPYESWEGRLDCWVLMSDKREVVKLYDEVLVASDTAATQWAKPDVEEPEKERRFAAKSDTLITLKDIFEDGSAVLFFSSTHRGGILNIPFILPKRLAGRIVQWNKNGWMKLGTAVSREDPRRKAWYDEAKNEAATMMKIWERREGDRAVPI